MLLAYFIGEYNSCPSGDIIVKYWTERKTGILLNQYIGPKEGFGLLI